MNELEKGEGGHRWRREKQKKEKRGKNKKGKIR